MILSVVREGTGAPSGRRAFLAAIQRLFRCDLLVALNKFSEDADILTDLPTCRNNRRRLAMKQHWNVCGMLLAGCCVLTTRASCRGRHVGWCG